MSKGNRIKELHKQEELERATVGTDAYKKVKRPFPWGKLVLGILILCLIVAGALVWYRHANEGLFNENSYIYSNYDKYVTLGDYKDLEYTIEETKVTDEQVQERIQQNLQAATTTKTVKKGKVADGDTVNIDYEGKIGGKPFDGNSAEGYDLTIGSGSFIDGFEDGLIGKKIGDTVDLKLQFPKDYTNEKVAGKKVVFTVKINSKSVSITPEYDEAFIKKNSDFDNKKDYEADVKKTLEKEAKESAENAAKSDLLQQAVDNAKMKKYPKGKYKHEYENIKAQQEQMVSQYGMSVEDYYTAMGTTADEMDKQYKESAKENVKAYLTINSIAKKEGVKVNDKEFKKYLLDLLESSGMTEEQFKDSYGQDIMEYAEENNMRQSYMITAVEDKLMELGKKVDKKTEEKTEDKAATESTDKAASEDKE